MSILINKLLGPWGVLLKVLKSWVVYSAQSRCQKPLRSMWLINPFQLIMAWSPIGCTLWLITQLIYSIYVIRWNKKAQQTSGPPKGQVHWYNNWTESNNRRNRFQVVIRSSFNVTMKTPTASSFNSLFMLPHKKKSWFYI